MTNSVMRGSFRKNSDLRREFLSLLSKKDRWLRTTTQMR